MHQGLGTEVHAGKGLALAAAAARARPGVRPPGHKKRATPTRALVGRAGQVPPLRLGWRYQATVSSSNPRSSMRP